MDIGTLFTGSEAVEAGLADELTEPVKIAAQFDVWQFQSARQEPPESGGSVTDGAADCTERIRAEAEAEAVAVRLRQIELDDVLTGASCADSVQ